MHILSGNRIFTILRFIMIGYNTEAIEHKRMLSLSCADVYVPPQKNA